MSFLWLFILFINSAEILEKNIQQSIHIFNVLYGLVRTFFENETIFESVKDAYLGRIDFIKHDCDDKEDGKAQCSRNNIRFLPTLLFRKTPQSEPVKYSGGPNGEVMVEFLNNMLNM